MSAQKNKALVRHFLIAHAKGDLGTLEEMLAPDFVDHNLLPGQRPGREGYLRAHTEYQAAYSHTRYVIDKQLAEGDEVVTTFAASAIHDRGEWMGLVPTGKQFEAQLVLIHRIVGGKIAEEWSQGSGLAELTQQRLEQEMTRAGAHRAGAQGGTKHPACLAAQGGAHPRGLADLPFLPASQRGGRRLLRLPPTL